jgi:hypothetical protein
MGENLNDGFDFIIKLHRSAASINFMRLYIFILTLSFILLGSPPMAALAVLFRLLLHWPVRFLFN